jgi:HTH-type transcriptional regulator / antitoxin HigA
MASNIKLPQSWVTRVTSTAASDDEVLVSGRLSRLPTEEDITAVLKKVAGGDAVREMVRRRWITPAASGDKRENRASALHDFLFSIGSHRALFAGEAMYRRQFRQRDLSNELASHAWLCRIMDRASQQPGQNFEVDRVSDAAISRLARLSTDPSGPQRAIAYLKELGVTVMLENALPGMRTDGASFVANGVGPVIGMTLRHDRLDSFWFTLLHEIGHIVLHLSDRPSEVFIDSLEDELDEIELEAEANAFAKDSFIPRDIWLRSDAFRFGTEAAVLDLAKRCSVHPAIVAGRLRFEKRKYHALTHLLGANEVRSALMAG